MKEVVTKKFRTWREIEHNRGKIIEGKEGFSTLIINAAPEPYDYSNWTFADLKDLADSIYRFLEVINKEHLNAKRKDSNIVNTWARQNFSKEDSDKLVRYFDYLSEAIFLNLPKLLKE